MPELLPFICQTDAFFEHAISTSARVAVTPYELEEPRQFPSSHCRQSRSRLRRLSY